MWSSEQGAQPADLRNKFTCGVVKPAWSVNWDRLPGKQIGTAYEEPQTPGTQLLGIHTVVTYHAPRLAITMFTTGWFNKN